MPDVGQLQDVALIEGQSRGVDVNSDGILDLERRQRNFEGMLMLFHLIIYHQIWYLLLFFSNSQFLGFYFHIFRGQKMSIEKKRVFTSFFYGEAKQMQMRPRPLTLRCPPCFQ